MTMTVKTMMKMSDEALSQIKLEMTPERRKRLTTVASKICGLAEANTLSPAEGAAALHIALDSFSQHYFGGQYKGTLILGDRDVPESICPGCGEKLNRAVAGDGSAPEPGCASICTHCGDVAVFGNDLKLVKPNDEQAKEIASDAVISSVIASVKARIQNQKQNERKA